MTALRPGTVKITLCGAARASMSVKRGESTQRCARAVTGAHRSAPARTMAPPGFWRWLLRTAAFYILFHCTSLISLILLYSGPKPNIATGFSPRLLIIGMLGLVQQNLGDKRLSPEQGTQLQALLKAAIVPLKMDDVELFRSPDAWAQYYLGVQQNIAEAAAGFLTPAQLEALKAIGAYDLTARQKQMAARRAALGIQ